jgi:flagellar biosynthesis regulator FlbT|tara:strand:+ start:1392 stop:1643 length:252 start_codon:yes stop_codon:yes gene_type:complete
MKTNVIEIEGERTETIRKRLMSFFDQELEILEEAAQVDGVFNSNKYFELLRLSKGHLSEEERGNHKEEYSKILKIKEKNEKRI